LSNLVDYSTEKLVNLTGKTVTAGLNALTTISAWETAQISGNTYHASYIDTTGIPASTSYFYFARNTSTNKICRIRPPQFNAPNTFAFQFIMSTAIMQLSGVTTSPTESDTIAIPTWNNGGSNTASLKVYYESSLGTWTWADTTANKLLKTYISMLGNPLPPDYYAAQLNPGVGFWAMFTNYGTSKLPYSFDIEWSELPQ
jgi:hypothetical protein